MVRNIGRRGAALVAFALLLTAVGCGYSEEQMQARLDQIETLEGQLRDSREQSEQLESRLAAVEARNQELVDRLRALGEEVEGLESERGNLQSSLQETQRALEELRARERAQQERLATFRRMLIELSENILFDSGRADLRDEGEVALSEIVQVLNSIPNRQFQVAGHTDNIPMRSSRFQSNWELSTARAVNVARFMIDQGLNAERISAAGYAETQPVASNSTPEGRAQNRRIEIVLVPNLDELPDLSSLSEEGGAS